MAHIIRQLSLGYSRKGSTQVLKSIVLSRQNSIRQLKISAVGSSSEKDARSYQSPSPHRIEIQASPPTLSHDLNQQATQYEPTLIANPSTTPTPRLTPDDAQVNPESGASINSAMSELSARKPELQISKRDLSNIILNQVDPRTISKVYYFDSLALSKKLESRGFTRDQAEGCVECLLEIIGNTLEHQAKHMITKAEQKIAEQQLQTEIMSVKKDMVLLQKSEFSSLRTETEKISIDIARIQSHFQDEVVKLKGQFTLDVNLERGRAVEAHAVSEKNLQMLNNKIETEIAHLKTTYEVYRNDIFKYAAGTVLTCTTLIIGFIRLWK